MLGRRKARREAVSQKIVEKKLRKIKKLGRQKLRLTATKKRGRMGRRDKETAPNIVLAALALAQGRKPDTILNMSDVSVWTDVVTTLMKNEPRMKNETAVTRVVAGMMLKTSKSDALFEVMKSHRRSAKLYDKLYEAIVDLELE